MKISEPECVALKRRGEEHVMHMLSGKSKQEEFEFWRIRTERLRISHNKAPHTDGNSAALHCRR